MINNVDKEFLLYEPMRVWLRKYLEDKYKGFDVLTIDSHSRTLDVILQECGILDSYPQCVGLNIQIDVLGILKNKDEAKIVFIEAKKNALNLHDLGQLWAYCKLCNPIEAFLMSPVGMGSLAKIVINLNRLDLLYFGDNENVKYMRIAKWNVSEGSPDLLNMVPKY